MSRYPAKPLQAALLSALAALSAGTPAVNLGNDGTGQVLIYPYYTTRTAGPGDWATYLNVVNHTGDTKALRLRFREGRNGRSVFDTNLYLSAGDVWAGAVVKMADGAQLLSADRSCVSAAGSFAQSVAAAKFSPAFSNAMYVGASTTQGASDGYDGEDTSLDRTREGFFEIIEMGVVTSTAIVNGLKHDAAGVPANCGVVANIDGGAIGVPRGGLSGGASLIHVTKGADFGYEPVVLEDFYRPANPADDLWSAPGNALPDLSQATPVSRVFYLHKAATASNPNGAVTDVLATSWERGIDAVSAVLMQVAVRNSFVLDEATQSSTDWIITLPTKHHYVSANAPGLSVANDPNGAQRQPPFHNFFWTGGATDPVSIGFHSNREGIVKPESLCPPILGCDRVGHLNWQANVGAYTLASVPSSDTDTLLGSRNRFPEREFSNSIGFQNGHSALFTTGPLPLVGTSLVTATKETYFGLPIVGFMVQDFVNSNVDIGGLPSASSYGGNFKHKYERMITGGNVSP